MLKSPLANWGKKSLALIIGPANVGEKWYK